MMDRDGFYEAVDRCYGHDETNKALFFSSLIAADIAGKAASAVLILSVWKLYGKLLKGVQAAGGGLATATGVTHFKHLGLIARAGIWVPLIYSSVKAYLAQKQARDELLEQDPALKKTMEAIEDGTISESEAAGYYADATFGNVQSAVDQLQAVFLRDLSLQIAASTKSF